MNYLPYKIINASSYYSHSTKPNQFCLEIILCRIHGAFDYLIYPYYPCLLYTSMKICMDEVSFKLI